MRRRDLILGCGAFLGIPRNRDRIGKPRVPFNNGKALTYAREYACKDDNACGVFLQGAKKSDCAHFVAHYLAAGGIRIANPDPNNALCPDGLAVRNTDLVNALRDLARTYANVREQDLVWDAIVGDVGFLHTYRPSHAFVIAEPVRIDKQPVLPQGPKAWAHSTRRCGEPLDAQFRQQWITTAFRLEDG